MADDCTLCLVGAMDSLWYYHIILFPEPISLLGPQPIPPNSITEAPSSSISQSPLQHQKFSLDSSQITPPQYECNSTTEDEEQETPTRSHSCSPSTPKQQFSKKLYYSSSTGTLPSKTMMRNFKTLWDLEREEVKGFIDLGFIFKKEQISQRMMSVVPGLQRLGEFKNIQKNNDQVLDATAEVADKDEDIIYDDEEEEEEEKKNIMRPYLSEAWLIKRPDSPLLNLRIPRVSAAADMKKHLRFWARTVASEIHQES